MTVPAMPQATFTSAQHSKNAALLIAEANSAFPPDLLDWAPWLDAYANIEPGMQPVMARILEILEWQLLAHCSAYGLH
jgi:hypothetical protein